MGVPYYNTIQYHTTRKRAWSQTAVVCAHAQVVNPAPLRLELKGVTVLQQIRHRQCERQWFLFRLAGGWLSRLVGC